MRRVSILLIVAAVVLLGALALERGGGAGAQNATPAAMAGHPLVGTWRTTYTEAGDEVTHSVVDTFAADGTLVTIEALVLDVAPDVVLFNTPALGTWEVTGDDSAAYTAEYFSSDGEGNFAGTVTVSGTRRASGDGQTLTGEFAYSVVDPGGNVIAAGRGTDVSTRLAVVPMESLATPAASPMASPAA